MASLAHKATTNLTGNFTQRVPSVQVIGPHMAKKGKEEEFQGAGIKKKVGYEMSASHCCSLRFLNLPNTQK